jgi:hypothetical protein
MGPLAARQVVIVHFPFSDLTASKLRPAAVLAEAGRGDWVFPPPKRAETRAASPISDAALPAAVVSKCSNYARRAQGQSVPTHGEALQRLRDSRCAHLTPEAF